MKAENEERLDRTRRGKSGHDEEKDKPDVARKSNNGKKKKQKPDIKRKNK